MSGTQRWVRRPEGSNWGEFGPDDEVGRLNMLTPERVRAAAAEVREGLAFCLSLPLDVPGGEGLNPRRHPPRRFATVREGRPNYNYAVAREDPSVTDVICDDAVLLHTQYSTQWDSLAHLGALFDADEDGEAEAVYYNGWRGGEHVLGPPGDDLEGVEARRLGIERMAATGVQGRGVMVDLLAHHGNGRTLVGREALGRAMDADGVVVEPGDILCLRTGFADALLAADRKPDSRRLHAGHAVLDGRDEALLNWITASGITALVADNYAVEQTGRATGPGRSSRLPLHEHCLFKIGVHLGEMWHLGPLADWLRRNGRSRFLLTAPPLRLPGAVGSPVTPVATV